MTLTFKPLWSLEPNPFDTRWHKIRNHDLQIDRGDNVNSFWVNWYQSVLDGKPMLDNAERTDEMLEKIALIAPEVWDQGEDVINPLIDEIWELYRLRVEVAALRAERHGFLAHGASAEHRSHNHPPELIDATKEIAQRTEIIWTVLDEAQAELEADAPDKARLSRIARSLLTTLEPVASYLAKVGDEFVMSAAKAAGTLAGKVMISVGIWQFAHHLLKFAGSP